MHEVSLPHKHADGGADGAAVEGKAEEAEVTIDERADEPLKANDQRTALARMRLLCNALKAKLTPLDKRSGVYSPTTSPVLAHKLTCACGGVCDFTFAVCARACCVCVCVCVVRRLEDDRGSDEGQIGEGH